MGQVSPLPAMVLTLVWQVITMASMYRTTLLIAALALVGCGQPVEPRPDSLIVMSCDSVAPFKRFDLEFEVDCADVRAHIALAVSADIGTIRNPEYEFKDQVVRVASVEDIAAPGAGRRIWGDTWDTGLGISVVLNNTMGSLAHEMLHVHDYHIGNYQTGQHIDWATNGYQTSINVYQSALIEEFGFVVPQ